MKFKRVLTSRATLKKMKEYDFPELTEEDIKEGKKRNYDNQLVVFRNHNTLGLYTTKEGKLNVTLFHSFDVFEEIGEDLKWD